ncbi:MAG: hypothetical protein ACOC2Y_04945 [Spirochaetota bacterium]
MQFDLFTFLASLFNFLVLLALLRIFLFKPVTKAMDEREERIANTWDEAEREKQEAEDLKAEYEEKMERVDEERDEMLLATREEMDRQERQRTERLREEIDAKREEWLQALESDKERLLRSVREEVAKATVESTRSALTALANVSLERRMVERLVEEIGSQGGGLVETLRGAEVEVTTSHRIGDDERGRIESKLREVGEPSSVSFAEAGDLVCGVRMQVGDREIGWSVSDHVAELESGITELIEAR